MKDTRSVFPASPDTLKVQRTIPSPGVQQKSKFSFKNSGGICPRDTDVWQHEPPVRVR